MHLSFDQASEIERLELLLIKQGREGPLLANKNTHFCAFNIKYAFVFLFSVFLPYEMSHAGPFRSELQHKVVSLMVNKHKCVGGDVSSSLKQSLSGDQRAVVPGMEKKEDGRKATVTDI